MIGLIAILCIIVVLFIALIAIINFELKDLDAKCFCITFIVVITFTCIISLITNLRHI